MASRIVMAQLSPTMEEGRLVEWKVSEGDEVNQGDVVAEIETDKANMDVEAMGSGVLREIVVQEGETVPVGTLIGVLGEPDEDISELLEEAGAGAAGEPTAEERAGEPAGESQAPAEGTGETEAAAGAPAAEAPGQEPEAGEAAVEEEDEAARPPGGEDRAGREARAPSGAAGDGRVRVSPVARRMAEEAGLDVSRIEGSGPSERVIKRDVEAALEEREAAPAARRPAAGRLEAETVEASQMRKAIARRLTESLGPVPHFFLTTEVDMERLLDLRAELNEGRGAGPEGGRDGSGGASREGDGGEAADPKIGVNDLLLGATAAALARHPEVNASWEDGSIRRHGSVDLGIAVAVEEGLITPVLRDAETKGLERIAGEAGELIRRARGRELAPEEYQGATFSVSNLGMFEIDEFTAVINPPESGILAVGRTAEKPVAVDGEVAVRRRMRVTMSCDHRVVDGATGARFLQTWKGMLENPLEMLL